MKIHDVIRSKRKEMGLTQEELARYIGVSAPAVNKWEKGLSYPDITLLPVLAAYFNLSIDDLIGYEPQMVKEDIKKLYRRLADRFVKDPFEEVKAECDGYIKKYYSCFPLLLQMALLLMNHYHLAEKPQEVMDEITELLDRITEESKDIHLAKNAAMLKCGCHLMERQPEEILDILGEEILPVSQEADMQAQAYQLRGNRDKALQAVQISMYQHLLYLIGDASMHIAWQQEESAKTEEIIRRTLAVADIFHMDHLHFNTIVQVYLASAQYYCITANSEEAIKMLERYTDCVYMQETPIKLHGDDYFDKVDGWLSELALGKDAPRGDAAIRQSIYQAVEANPLFACLRDNPLYKRIMKRLEEYSRGV